MKLTPDKKILIVGLGLLGGSYARALTKKGYTVKCITRSQSTVDYALGEKMVAYAATVPDPELIGEADLIVIALYPNVFLKWIGEYGKYIKKGAFVTDVTGVKSCIVYEVQSLLPDGVEFIASHPMAGREVSGAQNSDDSIFFKTEHRIVRIKIDDIRFIEGMSEYLKIHTDGRQKPVIVLLSMKKLEDRLPKSKFMRVHRSFIINLSKIQEVIKNRVIMDEDTNIPVGDLYKDAFNNYIESKFMGK